MLRPFRRAFAPTSLQPVIGPILRPLQQGALGLPPLVIACLAATWFIWGSTYLAIKFALVSFPPFFQMGTRFLVAGALLAAWLRWRHRTAWPDARQWRHAAIVGTLMLGGGMGFTALAETTVASGLVVAFIAVGPLVIAAFNRAFGIKPGRAEVAGMVVGLVGVVLLVRGAGFAASPAGLAAQAVAVIGWSLGSVLSLHRTPLAPGAMGFSSEMLAGGAVLMVMSLAVGEAPSWPPTVGATLAWLFLVVFGSLIAFNAYMLLLAHTSAAVASSYTFVNPVIAMLLGVTLGGELITGGEWLATGVILAGVVLLMWGKRQAG
ncbi:MAG: EamA family transporter [Rubrivivax sp.]|nr:EamA family transporter [Rubrivivax sp.]